MNFFNILKFKNEGDIVKYKQVRDKKVCGQNFVLLLCLLCENFGTLNFFKKSVVCTINVCPRKISTIKIVSRVTNELFWHGFNGRILFKGAKR